MRRMAPTRTIKRASPATQNAGGNMANAFRKPTPQGKIVNVAQKLGIPQIAGQQGTTRGIFHFLPLTEGLNTPTTYPFFKNVKNSQAPFTNIDENKLQTGEAIACERMYFVIMSVTDATGAVANYQTLDEFALPAMYGATWNLKIGSQDYTKDTPGFASKPQFNRNAMHATYNVYHFGTDTVIPPDVQFYLNLAAPQMTVPTSATLTFYFGCVIEGDGSILNMRETL